MTAEAWTALGTFATSLILLVTLLVVWHQVREARKLRRTEFRPYVLPRLFNPRGDLVGIEVVNVGRVPAVDVELTFDPPLDGDVLHLDADRRETWRLAYLPPGASLYSYLLGTARGLLNPEEHNLPPFPTFYDVSVSFRIDAGADLGDKQTVRHSYVLDIREMRGIDIGRTELELLTEKLDRHLKKITYALGAGRDTR